MENNKEIFIYQGIKYCVFEDFSQLVCVKEGIPYWTLFEGIKLRYNFKEGANEVIDIDLINLIENANWKKYPNPSYEIIEELNNTFDLSLSKDDFVN